MCYECVQGEEFPHPVSFSIFNLRKFWQNNVVGHYAYLFLDQDSNLHLHLNDLCCFKKAKDNPVIKLRVGGYFKESAVLGSQDWTIDSDWHWSFRLVDKFGDSFRVDDICDALKIIQNFQSVDMAMSVLLALASKRCQIADETYLVAEKQSLIENLEAQLKEQSLKLIHSQQDLADLKKRGCYCTNDDLVKENSDLAGKIEVLEDTLEQANKNWHNKFLMTRASYRRKSERAQKAIDKKNRQLKSTWLQLQEARQKMKAVSDFAIQKMKKSRFKTDILDLLK